MALLPRSRGHRNAVVRAAPGRGEATGRGLMVATSLWPNFQPGRVTKPEEQGTAVAVPHGITSPDSAVIQHRMAHDYVGEAPDLRGDDVDRG